MVEFLLSQGVKLNRVPYWPDYYDERPGGSEQGRTVVAELFDINELGDKKALLRPNFLNLPATLDEAMQLPGFKSSWKVRFLMVKIGLRSVWTRLAGKRLVTAGAALQGRMFQAALKASVEFRVNTPVRELIENDGAVVGVVVDEGGRNHRIRSRLGVLVNAGGFAHNQAMRNQYQPGTSAQWTNTAEGDTGEMILEMEHHGAALAQMEEMVGNQMAIPPGMENEAIKPVVQGTTASPHCILVDQTGVRYMNEGGSYMAYCKGMLERNKIAPAVPSWAIFDSQFIRKYMLAGSMPGEKKPKEWFDTGFMKKADTVADLAAQIGVPPEALCETVERFNGFVAQNRDDDFQRGVMPARGVEVQFAGVGEKDQARLGRIAFAATDFVEEVGGVGKDEGGGPGVIRLGGQGDVAHHHRVGAHAQQRHEPAVVRVVDADGSAARIGRVVVGDAPVARGGEVGVDVGAPVDLGRMPVAGIRRAQHRGQRRGRRGLVGEEQLKGNVQAGARIHDVLPLVDGG